MGYEPFNLAGGNTGTADSDTDGNGSSVDLGTSATFLGGSDGSGSGGSGGDAGSDVFDPELHISPDKRNADGSFRRKRQRRNAGTSSPTRSGKKADYSASVDSLARMLGYLHMGVAAATKTPELVLTEDETKALSNATANVLSEFDIRPSPKAEAIVGLVVTAGGIYGPRAYFIRERIRDGRRDHLDQ